MKRDNEKKFRDPFEVRMEFLERWAWVIQIFLSVLATLIAFYLTGNI